MTKDEYFNLLEDLFEYKDNLDKAIVFQFKDLDKELTKILGNKPKVSANLYKYNNLKLNDEIYGGGRVYDTYYEAEIKVLIGDVYLQMKCNYISLPLGLKFKCKDVDCFEVFNPELLTTVLTDVELTNIGLCYDFNRVVPFVEAVKHLKDLQKAAVIEKTPLIFMGKLANNNNLML